MALLKVIRASAGSGKTFRLTNEYMALLFEDADNFMHILAVTFTNKATEEMKTRIVKQLSFLSSGMPSDHLNALMNHTGLDEKTIRNKAGIILRKILHKYSRFSISTIDSFFQRIIRSFTHELGIHTGYSIELDVDMVTISLIDMLLAKLENDRSLLEWLSRYAETLIDQGDNWNFKSSLTRLGKEIFREELRQQLDPLMDMFSDRGFLGNYQSTLFGIIKKYRKEYREFGRQAVMLMKKYGLEVDDFSGKERGPAGFLEKLASGDFKKPTTAAIKAATDYEKWIKKDSPKREKIHEACINGLLDIMQGSLEYYQLRIKDINTAEQIVKNLFTLGILSDLILLVSEYCNENNVFLLPEASTFLHRIIQGNDTPFIYEKAGYWYHYFMIDEFQDTSLMQWENFKPLISNSLSQDYDNLVVGDVKQSIYRWRNSNWEILAEGIEKEYPPDSTGFFTLQENWRSGQKIIAFNNAFFLSAADMLQNTYNEIITDAGYDSVAGGPVSILNIYGDAVQKPGEKQLQEGYVQIDFMPACDDTDCDDMIINKLYGQLCMLLQKGYAQNQIAIITRKNSEAEGLAEGLLKYRNQQSDSSCRFDIISDDALRLESSSAVLFMVALLQYLVKPEDRINKYRLLSEYINYFSAGDSRKHFIVPENLQQSWEDVFDQIMPQSFISLAESPGSMSLTETVEQLLVIFKLSSYEGEIAYMQAFQDMILDFSGKYSADPMRFLKYWEETGSKKSVPAPAGQDAIRILTIHKSKGLEFDIVILPYCNWDLDSGKDTILWCNTKNVPHCNIDVLPVFYSAQLKETYFSDAYFNELRRQYVDNLNLLYVSFTRARKGLFAYCSQGKEGSIRNVSDLISNVIKLKGSVFQDEPLSVDFQKYFSESVNTFRYGVLAEVNRRASDQVKLDVVGAHYNSEVYGHTITEKLRIAFQGNIYLDDNAEHFLRPVNEGKIMHDIFSGIQHIDDIENSINRICLEGKIDAKTGGQLLKSIERKFRDIQVISWFTGEWNILTEAEIILPGGQVKRPDRVMVKGNNAVIIDFKFGKYIQARDKKQIREYVAIIKELGFSQAEGYLWYVHLEKIMQVA